jgi:Activator of Hsp90 ATPase homolog 1-like protein
MDPTASKASSWRSIRRAVLSIPVTYTLDPVEGGTRITLRQSGILSPDSSLGIGAGWETSFQKLEELLG